MAQTARDQSPHGTPPATGSLTTRIDALVDHRAALYEAISPVRRAAALSMHRRAIVSSQQSAAATVLRRQLAATFARELAEAAPSLLDALDLATSWEAWDRLRDRQGLGIGAARAVVADLVSRGFGRVTTRTATECLASYDRPEPWFCWVSFGGAPEPRDCRAVW